MTKYYLLLLSFLIIAISNAQEVNSTQSEDEEYSGMEAGLNVGVYFGSKVTANFYNGSGTNEEEMNSADHIIHNPYYREDINAVLEQNGYRYLLEEGMYHAEYPTSMVYLPSIYAGLTGRYWLKKKIGISVSMNFSRLTTKDNFVIYNEIDMPPSNKEDQYIIGTIAGQEDRINIDIGIINKFFISDRMNFIMEYGFNLNNTLVQFNKIEIYGLVLDIMYKGPHDYVPGGTQQQYTFRQGGIGYGAYLTPGLQFNFNENISVDLVSQFYYNYIDLEHYNQWTFNWAPYIRFNFTRLFM
jgi:hypothetical protein